MADVDRTSRSPDPIPTDEDRLLSRLVDAHASDDDRELFKQIAAADPSLWQDLAHQQRGAALLGDALNRRLGRAILVDLPVADTRPATGVLRGAGGTIGWLAAMVGWAAVLVLAVVMANGGGRATPTTGGIPIDGGPSTTPRTLSAEEHWRAYLQAPFVSEEMAPLVLESQPLADGGIRLRIIRRIEETYDLTPRQAADMLDGLDEILAGGKRIDISKLDEIRSSIEKQTTDPGRY